MRSESGLAKGRQFKTAALLEEEHMRLFTVLLPMLLLIGVGAIAVILALSAFLPTDCPGWSWSP